MLLTGFVPSAAHGSSSEAFGGAAGAGAHVSLVPEAGGSVSRLRAAEGVLPAPQHLLPAAAAPSHALQADPGAPVQTLPTDTRRLQRLARYAVPQPSLSVSDSEFIIIIVITCNRDTLTHPLRWDMGTVRDRCGGMCRCKRWVNSVIINRITEMYYMCNYMQVLNKLCMYTTSALY